MGRRHLAALVSIGARVTAIADDDAGALEAAASMAREARHYCDWQSLLANERPDLLCVATTSPAHAPIVVAAAEAGLPRVMCEKPLATSLGAARAMLNACAASGTRLVVNHSRRVLPAYLAVRAALLSGDLGDIRFVRASCGNSGLANIGTHAFDLMHWFCGPAEAVIGYIEPSAPPNPRGPAFHDPGGHGLIEFGGGRRATFDFTSDFPTSFVFELGCAAGRVVVHEQTGSIESTGSVPLEFGPAVDIVAMTAAMLQNALSDGQPACTGQDGYAALEMAAAVHLSDGQGHRRTALPVVDDEQYLARVP